MTDLYLSPELDMEDGTLLEEITEMRAELLQYLRVPRRWTGQLRRSALARAIRGSNSIEGINVALDDADAALDDEPPLDADARTFAEVRGYRQALGYILAMRGDPDFQLDETAIRSMHFMMLSHDLTKSPGQYRRSDIYVEDERSGDIVYTGPDADALPDLMATLSQELERIDDADPLVKASMAHLNLVMIHPFRDGNGRMSRALQTLLLARTGIAEPEFASVEEWLGANTSDYYRALAATGGGAWNPQHDAHLWVKFMLRAHHMQAQTVARRFTRAERIYAHLLELTERHRLPDRVLDVLYPAVAKYRITRPSYVTRAAIDERTATRDLRALSDLGLLTPRGETRGRYYVRGPALEAMIERLGPRPALRDPLPWLIGTLHVAARQP